MKYAAVCREFSGNVAGEGMTQEEAVRDCLAQVRQGLEIWVEIVKGVVLPLEVVATMPKTLPEGYGLFILFDTCGGYQSYRFFAVRYGTHQMCRHLDGKIKEVRESEYTVSQTPAIHVFCGAGGPDRHGFAVPHERLLPVGSEEFVCERWVPCRKARYEYPEVE